MTKGYAIIGETATGLTVSYEDFDVEAFDGADYEATYTLDGENREKLRQILQTEGLRGTLEEMILEHFGRCLDKDSFSNYCDRNRIDYDLFTWNS